MSHILRTAPSCAVVPPEEIKGRIDASYYDERYNDLDKELSRFRSNQKVLLGDLLDSPRRILYQKTTTFEQPNIPDEAIPFISGVDLDGDTMSINWSRVKYVESWMADRYPKGKLFSGALLIKVKGPNQHTVYVSENNRLALVSGTVFFSKTKGCDPYYLTSYLSCKSGVKWRSRLRTNTTVEFIGNEELRNVPVLLPDEKVQRFIGKQLELAEECRRRADALLKEANQMFDQKLLTSSFAASNEKSNFIDLKRLQERIAAEFYLPKYYQINSHFTQIGLRTIDFGSACESIFRSSTPKRSDAGNIPCLLTTDIKPYKISHTQAAIKIEPNIYRNHVGKLQAKDIVYSSICSPHGDAAIVLPHWGKMSAGGDVTVIRANDDFHPGYLCLFLNSIFGRMQSERYSRGSVQRRVYPDDIESFSLPHLSKDEQNQIGRRVIQFQILCEKSFEISSQAKEATDKLVKGHLDTDAILSGKLKAPTWEDIEKELEGI